MRLGAGYVGFWLSLAGLGLTTFGCGEPSKNYSFAWMPKASTNAVFFPGQDGAKLRGKDLTRSGPNMVDVRIVAPDKQDADMQAGLVDTLVAQKISGIAISCTDSVKVAAALDRAAAAGVPVMTWDSDCAPNSRFTFYSVDNRAGGLNAAELLAKELGETGQVAVLAAGDTDPNIEQRVNGFKDGLAMHPGLTLGPIVRCLPSEDALCPGRIEDALAANPNLRGFFFAAVWLRIIARDTTMLNAPTWRAQAKSGALKTVAFDSLPEALPFVKDGSISALIGQKYWGWGYDSVKMLYDHVTQAPVVKAFTDSGVDLVCGNNVGSVETAWMTNDFSMPLAKCAILQ